MFKDGSMKKFLKGVDKINHLGFMFRIRLCELRTMKKRFPLNWLLVFGQISEISV